MPVTRTVNGETRQWDGSQWVPIASEPEPSTAGLFSGGLGKLLSHPLDTIKDLWSGVTEHPADTMRGFLQGAGEGAPTAATIAQTVLIPALTGGMSIPAQMAAGAGGQALADAADLAAGHGPRNFGDFAFRAGVGAAIPGVIGGVVKGAQALKGAGPAVDAALEVGSHTPGLRTVSRLGRVLRGLGGGVETETANAAASEIPSGFAQQPKRVYIDRPDATVRSEDWRGATDYWPARDTAWEGEATKRAASAPRLAGKAPTLEDELQSALNSVRSPEPPSTISGRPSVSSMTDSTSGGLGAEVKYSTGKPAVEAPWYDDLAPRNYDAMGDRVDLVRQDLADLPPEDISRVFRDPGPDVPNTPAAQALERARTSDTPKTLSEWFDRGAVDSGEQAFPMKGEEGYVPDAHSANLIFDPQTPSSDLRALYDTAEDPMTKAFYARALDQRHRIAAALNGLGRYPRGIHVLDAKFPGVE